VEYLAVMVSRSFGRLLALPHERHARGDTQGKFYQTVSDEGVKSFYNFATRMLFFEAGESFWLSSRYVQK
jgi:hypothetical protein